MRSGLQDELKAALKSRDRVAISALRSALAAIANAEAVPADQSPDAAANGSAGSAASEHVVGAVNGLGATEARRRELSAADLRSIVAKEVEDRSAAASEYEGLGQHEVAGRLRSEAAVLSRLL